MLAFAAIMPHPPILVEGIGKENELERIKKTIDSMKYIGDKVEEADLDILIIVSPHGVIHSDKMTVYSSPKFYGDFGSYNKKDVSFNYENDLPLATAIVKNSINSGINAFLFGNEDSDYFEFDHGEMVPLYFLEKHISEDTKIIPVSYSYLDKSQHFAFGQVLNDVINSSEFKNMRIGIIASGDLSHRLFQGSKGYKDAGVDFDKQIVELVSQNNSRSLLELEDEFIEEAGECGYKSIVLLFGALEKEKYKANVLSYEGPFGVGYMVVYFELLSQ